MTGTKRRRSNGSWEVRVYLGRDPVQRQLSRTVLAPRVLRRLLDANISFTIDGVGATFGDLIDAWLEECVRLDLSPTTLRTYRSQVERTIRPALGHLRLSQLAPKHLDDLYDQMKRDGLSAKTIRNHHAIVAAALGYDHVVPQ